MDKVKILDTAHHILYINEQPPLLEIKFLNSPDLTEVDLSVIQLLNQHNTLCRTFKGYTTIYRQNSNHVILSNNRSVYKKPKSNELIDPDDPNNVPTQIPTLDDEKTMKIKELNQICNNEITSGFMSNCFDGVNTLPYDCKITDQSRINGLVSVALLVINGLSNESIKWKNSNQTVCEIWAPQQIMGLALDMKRHIERNIERYDSLKEYIYTLTSIDDVKSVKWTTPIPIYN